MKAELGPRLRVCDPEYGLGADMTTLKQPRSTGGETP
jgi:hypothetical protein